MAGTLKGAAAIVGVAESELGETPHKTALHLQVDASLAALDDAGLKLGDVDGVLTQTFGAGMNGNAFLEYLGLHPRYVDTTSYGGASNVGHVIHAAAAIQAGLCEVALVAYAATPKTGRGGGGGGGARDIPSSYDLPWGFAGMPSQYALHARRHMHEFGTTSEQFAAIAVSTRKWASMNPKAYMRDPITIADVLNSRIVADPLHKLDCCLVTDGGGAAVVTSAARAKDLKKPPVYLLGAGEGHSHRGVTYMESMTHGPAALAAPTAFRMAGVTHADIDVLEVYDAFTSQVLCYVEDLGFCKKGEGGAFLSDGKIAPGGKLPMNTNGGGLSYCHSGMYGMYIVIEGARQVRGECGPRQVKDVELTLVCGNGGSMSSAAVLILGKDK